MIIHTYQLSSKPESDLVMLSTTIYNYEDTSNTDFFQNFQVSQWTLNNMEIKALSKNSVLQWHHKHQDHEINSAQRHWRGTVGIV